MRNKIKEAQLYTYITIIKRLQAKNIETYKNK